MIIKKVEIFFRDNNRIACKNPLEKFYPSMTEFNATSNKKKFDPW